MTAICCFLFGLQGTGKLFGAGMLCQQCLSLQHWQLSFALLALLSKPSAVERKDILEFL